MSGGWGGGSSGRLASVVQPHKMSEAQCVCEDPRWIVVRVVRCVDGANAQHVNRCTANKQEPSQAERQHRAAAAPSFAFLALRCTGQLRRGSLLARAPTALSFEEAAAASLAKKKPNQNSTSSSAPPPPPHPPSHTHTDPRHPACISGVQASLQKAPTDRTVEGKRARGAKQEM